MTISIGATNKARTNSQLTNGKKNNLEMHKSLPGKGIQEKKSRRTMNEVDRYSRGGHGISIQTGFKRLGSDWKTQIVQRWYEITTSGRRQRTWRSDARATNIA